MSTRQRALILVWLLCFSSSALAYVHLRNNVGEALHWERTPIQVTLHADLVPSIADGSDEVAVREAFATWAQASEGSVSFAFDDSNDARRRSDWASDDVHMVYADRDNSSGFFPAGSGLVAITPIEFDPTTGAIRDADILIDARQAFSTRGDRDAFDLQSVITHEIGHLLGLDHSGVHGATLVPVPRRGDTAMRTLSSDDVAGLRALYPGSSRPGSLTGVVQRSNGTPLRGAHVVAEDADGRPVAAALSALDGRYRIEGLPAGDYVVYAEPVHGSLARHLDTRTQQRGLDTDFGVTFWGPRGQSSPRTPATVTVSYGAATELAPLTARAPGELHRTALEPMVLVPGERVRFRASGSGLVSGVRFLVTGPPGAELLTSDALVGLSRGSLTVEAPSHARFQSHSLRVIGADGLDCWVLTGAFEVRDHAPAIDGLSPADATPGQRAELTGRGFRAGARLLIGGRLVTPSGIGDRVSFSIPPLPPGSYDVTLENPDGQIATLAGGLVIPGATGNPSAPDSTATTPASQAPSSGGTTSGASAAGALAPSSGGGGGGCSMDSNAPGRPAGALLLLLACVGLLRVRAPRS